MKSQPNNTKSTMNRITLAIVSTLLLGFASYAQTTTYGSTGLNQTNSSQPTVFKNNGTEYVRIQPNGNLGIGTNAPSEKLEIIGNLKVSGTITSSGTSATNFPIVGISDKLNFGPNNEVSLKFVPAATNTPALMTFGKLPPANFIPNLQCTFPTLPSNSVVSTFPGMLYSFGNNSNGNLNLMSMGYDGANAIIDIAGEVAQSGNPSLLLNYYCGKDIYMCTGSNGGYVQTGSHFEVGSPARNFDIAANILGATRIKYAGSYGSILELLDGSSNTKFLVAQGGNVGIGTTNPQQALDVYGNIAINNNDLLVRNSHHGIGWYQGVGTNNLFSKSSNANGIIDGPVVFGYAGGALGVKTIESSTEVNRIALLWNTAGDIGVGTTTPSYKLDVRGVISNGGADFILGKYDGRSQGSNTANRALVHDDGDKLVINYGGDFEGGVIMNGIVGIGTSNPDANYKLSVNGDIRAKRVKVETGWSDYVFDKNYRLMTIEQVDTFIKNNKHLPGVQSGSEIEENGLDIGEMQATHMKKIEELTLYIIELHKKMEAMQKQMDSLTN